jgi:hypothetical protein
MTLYGDIRINIKIIRWMIFAMYTLRKLGYDDFSISVVHNHDRYFNVRRVFKETLGYKSFPCWVTDDISIHKVWYLVVKRLKFVLYLRRWQRRMLRYVRIKIENRRRRISMCKYLMYREINKIIA